MLTDFLRQNYTLEYGRFIRALYQSGRLPVPVRLSPAEEIRNVRVAKGIYNRTDRETLEMHIVCEVLFESTRLYYLVHGYFSETGPSDFFDDIAPYHGEYIRCEHPLDAYGIPILRRSDYETVAREMLGKYCPGAVLPVRGYALARAMGCALYRAKLSPDGSVRAKLLFEPSEVTVYDSGGVPRILKVPAPAILSDGYDNAAILHECAHAYLHSLFYDIRRLCGEDVRAFDVPATKGADEARWMELQAEGVAECLLMPEAEVRALTERFLESLIGEPDWGDYRELIDMVRDTFGVTRSAAKKRPEQLGCAEVRGARRLRRKRLCGRL